MNSTHFYGASTALITPMRDGRVAYDDLEKLVEFQIEKKIDGLVAVGTTGESPTLSTEEHVDVIAAVVKAAAGRVPVIAGAGSNSTEEAVYLTKAADDAGADAILHVAPYYNKPNQEGIYRHFAACAAVTEKPIILYSIPGRCIVDIGIETCARLYSKYPHVLGIKESGGSNGRVDSLSRALGDDYLILSGEDENTLPYMSLGCHGVISVASNLFPGEIAGMVQAARDGSWSDAMAINRRFRDFFKHIFVEPNPAPIKYCLMRAGIIQSDELRLPLCEIADSTRELLDATLHALEVETVSA